MCSSDLDDDAGGGGEIGLDVGVGAFQVAGGDRQAGIVQLAGERFALDEEINLDAQIAYSEQK